MGSNISTFGGASDTEKYLDAIWRSGICDIPDEKKGGFAAQGGVIGGIGDLTAEYDTSVSSRGKRDLIKKLALGVSKAMRVKPPNISASNDELVAHLIKIVPNPRKNKSIIPDVAKQEKLCKDVADVVNKSYGQGNIIDKSLGPNGICNQVSDVVESLSAGLNQEYVAVAASVTRSLQNLSELSTMLERSYGKLHSEVSNSDDEALRLNSTGIKSVHDLIMSELNRQLAILTNLTNTNLKTVDRDMAKLLAENKDFKGLVYSIKKSVGTSEWGDKLGYWLSGVSSLAQIANRVDKALKTIGMKASDYRSQNKLSDLILKTHDLMENLPSTKTTREFTEKFENAVEILKKHHGKHSKLSKLVKGAGALGGCDCDGGVDGVDGVDGGRVKLSKKLKNQQRTRIIMLNDFKTKAKIYMDRVYQAVFGIGKAIGSGKVRLSDDLYRFKTVLEDLTNVFVPGIEYALTGYYTYINAVERKQRFLSLIQALVYAIEPLKSTHSGFREIGSNLEAVTRLMDFYQDRFTVHLGSTAKNRSGGDGEIPGGAGLGKSIGKLFSGLRSSAGPLLDKTNAMGSAAGELKGQAQAAAQDAAHSATQRIEQKVGELTDGKYEGGGEFKAVVTLVNARNTFNHFYNIAKFKRNLSTVSTEMKEYNKNYSTVVGSAVGREIQALRVEHKKVIDELKGLGTTGVSWVDNIATTLAVTAGATSNIGLYTSGGNANDHKETLGGMGDKGEWSAEHIEKLLTAQLVAKEKLYKVAQAVDEYLQKFTDAVVASPEDVQEVAKLLGDVELVANWFSEKSGDSLSSLYEIFPWGAAGMRTFMNSKLQAATCMSAAGNITAAIVRTRLPTTGHYYKKVEEHLSTFAQITVNTLVNDAARVSNGADGNGNRTGLPGNPFLPISPARALFAHKFAKYTVEKIFVLKNIVSAFSYLGKKFGDVDLTGSTFLSPNDMYKHLVEYLYVSALTHGWGDSVNMRRYGLRENNVAYVPTVAYQAGVTHTFANNVVPTSCPSHVGGAASTLRFNIGPYFPPSLCSIANIEGVGAGTSDAQSTLDYKSANDLASNWPEQALPAVPGTQKRDLQRVTDLRREFSSAMSCIEDSELGTGRDEGMSGWKSQFYKTDVIFINIIKAMAAKVFTVTGLYNMLNFSGSGSIKNYALSPTRLVLGGATRTGGDSGSYALPKVYADAVELYARLPLLAEFYRDIFCFEEACADQVPPVRPAAMPTSELMISMVPEVGSLWSGFITTIFDQPINTNGMYTDNVFRRLVHELNKVYMVFKQRGSKSIVSDAISDFVAEVNSRYGLMNRAEINEYDQEEKNRRQRLDYGNSAVDPDFDILDEDNISSGIAPSDRYIGVNQATMPANHTLDVGVYNALREFRKRIDNRIAKIALNAGNGFDRGDYKSGIPDFGQLIMTTRESLANRSDPASQFSIVKGMMGGMDARTQLHKEASVMYHEAVIAPLAALTSITNMLKGYRDECRNWDGAGLFKALETGLAANGPLFNAAAPVMGNNFIATNAAAQLTTLAGGYANVTVTNLLRSSGDTFVHTFMGFNSGLTADLGSLVDTFRDGGTWRAEPGAQHVADRTFRWNRHVAYLCVRWEACFKHLVNAVYGLSADLGQLCEVSYQGGRVVVNHTKLQTVCEEVLATVRQNIDKFRGVLPTPVIETQFAAGTEGSMMWVHDELIGKLFADNDGSSGLKRAHQCVTESLLALGNFHPGSLGNSSTYYGLASYATIAAAPGTKRAQGWCIDGPLSEMTHYNPVTATSVVHSGCSYGVDARAVAEPHFQFASPGSIKVSPADGDAFVHVSKEPGIDPSRGRSYSHPVFANRMNFYLQDSAGGDNDPGFRGDGHGHALRPRSQQDEAGALLAGAMATNASNFDLGAGLQVKFNEVMSQYITQFWDVSSSKIYAPLLDVPANGPLNQAVFKARGHPDHASSSLLLGLRHTTWSGPAGAPQIDPIGAGLNAYSRPLETAIAGDGLGITFRAKAMAAAIVPLLNAAVAPAVIPPGTAATILPLTLPANVNHIKNAARVPGANILIQEVLYAMRREHKTIPQAAVNVITDAIALGWLTTANPPAAVPPPLRKPTLSECKAEYERLGAPAVNWAGISQFLPTISRVLETSNAHALATSYAFAHHKFLVGIVSGLEELPVTHPTHVRVRAILTDNDRHIQCVIAAMDTHGDPTELLYSSLGNAIRIALGETTHTGSKANVVQSIAEVPLRVKEAMKAQLPIFSTMFKLMSKRSDLLKTVLRLPVGVDRLNMNIRFGVSGMAELKGVHGGIDASTNRSQSAGKTWYSAWLDRISISCDAMVNNIRTITNELNDAPLFLETMENSIVDYKNKTGVSPLMPVSTLSLVLAPGRKSDSAAIGNWQFPLVNGSTYEYRDPSLGYPGSSVGDPLFMLNYGARLLLNDSSSRPQPEHMPGVADIVQAYNTTAHGKHRVDAKSHDTFTVKIVELLRYAGHTKIYAALFGAERRVVDPTLQDKVAIQRAANQNASTSTYQQQHGVTPSMDLVTNSDKSASCALLAGHIDGAASNAPTSRNTSIIYNLLDLNISPINVHAMRREIPLVNLFNYAYTFDSFITHSVKSMYDGEPGVKGPGATLRSHEELSTHDVLGALCKRPYIRVPRTVFYTKLEMLISGNSSLDLYGYPKFVADQLWGKLLLQDAVIGNKWMANSRQGPIDATKRRTDRLNMRRPAAVGALNTYNPTSNALVWNNEGKRDSANLQPVPGGVPPLHPRDYLAELGRLRFDTKLARNMLFLANVQRLMTSKIEEELTVMQYPVVSNAAITNRKLTDYRDGETVADLRID